MRAMLIFYIEAVIHLISVTFVTIINYRNFEAEIYKPVIIFYTLYNKQEIL